MAREKWQSCWAGKLKAAYGCDAVIYSTGFKGIHVVIPLKQPTDWEGYKLTYHALLNLDKRAKFLNDWSMLQPNRLDRIPYTWNVKEDGRAYVTIIDLNGKELDPTRFDWSSYEPLDITKVEVTKVTAPVP